MRSAGVLLHPTSLPGRFGIGDLGPAAREFLGVMATMGQSWWQMLPIGPTGYADSPYQAPSTFAGNPLLLSPEDLVTDHLLTIDDLDGYPDLDSGPIDFAAVIPHKLSLLRKAAMRLADLRDHEQQAELDAFRVENAHWLNDYALFAAIKTHFDGKPWFEWPAELATRQPDALQEARNVLRAEILSQELWQYLFDRQWKRLQQEAANRRVGLIGDLPIFSAHDSSDVWANQEQFQLDGNGHPTVVAGVPPDYFSRTGQRWGNPLYRWERMQADDFSWWVARFQSMIHRFDLVRVDHFRGFAAYWEIPAPNPTAVEGRWVEVPGRAMLSRLQTHTGHLPIIAEDLGVITDDVIELRDAFDLPGMRVLQFGFAEDPGHSQHHPDRYVENAFCYTGTHDNDTTVGWFWGENRRHDRRRLNKERRAALNYLQSNGNEINWDMIEAACNSICRVAIAPAQDLLGLDSSARMNTPATVSGNWTWRLPVNGFTAEIMERMRHITAKAGRS